jgi:hypothetical protein
MKRSVLLDTSFFLRFLNTNDPLFQNADGYFKYFLREDISMYISTISIAEYCVGGDVDQLPMKNLQIIPFNIDHAKLAGEFARVVFDKRRSGDFDTTNRNIIPNDSKLFAQASLENSIEYFVTSDSECLKVFTQISEIAHFKVLDINVSHGEIFGELNLCK